MDILLITRNENGQLVFSPPEAGPASNFCEKKRKEKDSKCAFYYSQLFDKKEDGKRHFSRCPYGLDSVGPIYWTERPRIASGFLLDDKSTAPSPVPAAIPKTTRKEVESYLSRFDKIAEEYYHHSYEYLESAIHDVRHLNSAITSHAERLLKELGCDMGQEWDLGELNRTETGKKALSVFCASRDISSALSMHEIAIDPRRAKDELVPHHIHKLFYKQSQISADKKSDKKLSIQLSNTTKILQLTKSFSLIPMILLNNALKYSSSGSVIKVDFQEAGNFFRIICSNSGALLRPDELPRVFDKHWRGSNSRGADGHGIGLWLAKLIVEANSGTIDIHVNEKGRDIAARRLGETSITIRLLQS